MPTLKAPNRVLILVSLILAIVTWIGSFTHIAYIGVHPSILLTLAYVLLALGCLPFDVFYPFVRLSRRIMEKVGVTVGLATISVVGAAVLFSAERVRTGPMTFIERYLNISPDGGDGSMELLLLVAVSAIVFFVALVLRRNKF
jgi:hypothetical protein